MIGNHQYSLQTANFTPAAPLNPNATPSIQILDANGQDVTGHVVGGTLGGLLTVRNSVLPCSSGR